MGELPHNVIRGPWPERDGLDVTTFDGFCQTGITYLHDIRMIHMPLRARLDLFQTDSVILPQQVHESIQLISLLRNPVNQILNHFRDPAIVPLHIFAKRFNLVVPLLLVNDYATDAQVVLRSYHSVCLDNWRTIAQPRRAVRACLSKLLKTTEEIEIEGQTLFDQSEPV